MSNCQHPRIYPNGNCIECGVLATSCPGLSEAHQVVPRSIHTLTCCCCGESTRGRQWWNRDTGYGMCVACIAYVRSRGMSEEEIQDLYGREGIHWGVEKKIYDGRNNAASHRYL